MSRQVNRWIVRMTAKDKCRAIRDQNRKQAKRDLLERQSAREKAGFYTGKSVASVITPSRSRLDKRKVRKGKPFGRVIFSETADGYERSFHATKGWRSSRV